MGSRRRTRKVVIADDVSIPGNSEALIDVFVERVEEDDLDQKSDYLVEPTDHFKESYQLLMASTLVDINKATTCKIRLLNPFASEVVLRQDAEVGTAEQIERVISVVASEEDSSEAENQSSLRRVGTAATKKGMEPPPAYEKTDPSEVPAHLMALYEQSTDGKPEPQRRAVAGLLIKYQDTFSKSDWDIGLTDLAEHPIDTGGAAPVKQRPRRVPLAYADEEQKAIEDLLKKGVIQKSTSPWASPIVLVKKNPAP